METNEKLDKCIEALKSIAASEYDTPIDEAVITAEDTLAEIGEDGP